MGGILIFELSHSPSDEQQVLKRNLNPLSVLFSIQIVLFQLGNAETPESLERGR